MDESETRELVHRLLSGYLFVGNYIIDIPSTSILAEADHIYNQFLYNNRFEPIVDKSITELLLLKNRLWSLSEKSQLESIPSKLDKAKLDLYKSLLVPSQQKLHRKQIETLKQQYNNLTIKRSLFDQYTIQFWAEQERERFIFSNIILNKNYESVKLPPLQLDKILAKSKKQDISIKKYRELARSDYWQSVWSSSKTSAFRAIGDEQRTLVSYTHLYENILKHPEAPNQEVINDDDMLDGWMIFIKEKNEEEKKSRDFDKAAGDKAKYGEQFIIAKTPDDIAKIIDMNDTRAKIIQKKIHLGAKQKDGKPFNEYEIQEIQQEANVIKR